MHKGMKGLITTETAWGDNTTRLDVVLFCLIATSSVRAQRGVSRASREASKRSLCSAQSSSGCPWRIRLIQLFSALLLLLLHQQAPCSFSLTQLYGQEPIGDALPLSELCVGSVPNLSKRLGMSNRLRSIKMSPFPLMLAKSMLLKGESCHHFA